MSKKLPNLTFLAQHHCYKGDDCVLWPHSRDLRGYGTVWFRQKIRRASRVMCELVHGPAPSPVHQAAHSCDNRLCVNPNHLSWKTNAANQADRRRNGTHATNKTGSRTPLTPEQIAEIRGLIGRITVTAIAAKFNISRRTVERIRAGRQYKPPGKSRNRACVRPLEPTERFDG